MSIADGQVVLERSSEAGAPVSVDARLSVSRIGSRAYPPALALLAPSIRLHLAQVSLCPSCEALFVSFYLACSAAFKLSLPS